MRYINLHSRDSDFSCDLLEPLQSGDWEAALVEISFANTFQIPIKTE